MINKVILIGRLGADPRRSATPKGLMVSNFNIATTDTWAKDGNKHERTEWHRIVAFGKLAEICNEFLKCGAKVYLEGRIQTRAWEDREGIKRSTTEIILKEMKMLESPKARSAHKEPHADMPTDDPPAFDDDMPEEYWHLQGADRVFSD